MRATCDQMSAFYRSRRGRAVRDLIARRIGAHWQSWSGQSVLAYGYAHPWLDELAARARPAPVMWACPASQGALRWPDDAACSATVVTGEPLLPFASGTFGRVFLVHALEESADLPALLREIWRVTTPAAHVLVVAANLFGAWAHIGATPFARGQAVTRSGLEAALTEALFTPGGHSYALFTPPLFSGDVPFWERTCGGIVPVLGGVLLIEARKDLYGSVSSGLRRSAPNRNPLAARLLHRCRSWNTTLIPIAKETPADAQSPTADTRRAAPATTSVVLARRPRPG